jgi:hypothetical protein
MKVTTIANTVALMTLLDSGLMQNVSDTVVNGDCISSLGYYCDLFISIGGEVFLVNCYMLALGSYDMVLRVQWLESLGLILWDFDCCTMAFVRGGHKVL